MIAAAWLLWASSVGLAQGFDAHGPTPPPPSASRAAPLWTTDADVPARRSWSAGVLGGVATSPLVRERGTGAALQREVLLGSVLGLDLGGTWTPVSRVQLGATLPLFAATTGEVGGGPALGDLRLQSTVALVEADGAVPALAVVPVLTLPTGAAARYLGEGGLGGGGRLAAGWRTDGWTASAEVGVQAVSRPQLEELGGVAPVLGGAFGRVVSDALTLQLEARAHGVPDPDGRTLAALPAEVALTARGTPGWTASLGAGLTPGPGAAAVRGAVGFTWGRHHGAVPMPEVADDSAVTLRVVDAAGHVVRDAALRLGDEVLGRTDAEGELEVSRSIAWRRGPHVVAAGFADGAVAAPDDSTDRVEVTLDWLPVDVQLRVVDPAGTPLDADLTLTGEQEPPVPVRDDLGTFSFALTPGLWTLEIGAPGRGSQIRNLVVPAGRQRPMQLDAVLYEVAGRGEMVLTVIDPDGDPIEGAYVQVGGRVVGTTGTGGDLRVTALEEGRSDVAVSHEDFEAREPVPVELTPDGSPIAVELTHLPGSVEVWVRGPDGHATDALLAFRGPTSLPPIRVGRDGRHVVVLSEGSWSLVVSSPTLGMQVRDFEVHRDDPELRRLDIDLLPAGGTAELALRVADREGAPMVGAEVMVEGRSAGRTGTDGTLRLGDLPAAPTLVEVLAPRTGGWAADVDLSEGLADVDVTLDWLPGSVTVRAMGPGGPVEGALVTATSEGREAITHTLDRRGRTDLELEPGEWEVLVSAASLGMQARAVTVEPDQTTLVTVDFRLADTEGGRGELQLAVVAEDGTPVDDARVFLDGADLGTTSNAGEVRLLDLRTGTRTLRVEAPGHQPVEQSVRVASSARTETFRLPWAPGALRLSLSRGEVPVTDALVRFAGPATLPPVAPDARGELQVALVPGDWTLLVSSPSAGLRQEAFSIAVDDGLRTLALDLGAPPASTSVLLLRVRDEDHQPLAGVEVTAGSVSGITSSGGMVLLSGLVPGPTSLSIDAPEPLVDREESLELPEGSHQATVLMSWPRAPVHLTTRADTGPRAARVWLDGPAVHPLLDTGEDGSATVELRAGPWRAYGDAGGDVGAADFDVVDDDVDVTIRLERLLVPEASGTFRFEEAVLFDTGQAGLLPAADPLLDAIAEHLHFDASIVLAEVQGHTDDVGSLELNLGLSQRRAEAVVAALVERGVAPERLRARGYAMLRPMAQGTDAEARRLNRRVEVHVVERAASAEW